MPTSNRRHRQTSTQHPGDGQWATDIFEAHLWQNGPLSAGLWWRRGGMSAFNHGLILNNGVLYDKGHYKGV